MSLFYPSIQTKFWVLKIMLAFERKSVILLPIYSNKFKVLKTIFAFERKSVFLLPIYSNKYLGAQNYSCF